MSRKLYYFHKDSGLEIRVMTHHCDYRKSEDTVEQRLKRVEDLLTQYQNEVDIPLYASELRRLLSDMEKKYGYSELDSLLVLKDILALVWKNRTAPKNT